MDDRYGAPLPVYDFKGLAMFKRDVAPFQWEICPEYLGDFVPNPDVSVRVIEDTHLPCSETVLYRRGTYLTATGICLLPEAELAERWGVIYPPQSE